MRKAEIFSNNEHAEETSNGHSKIRLALAFGQFSEKNAILFNSHHILNHQFPLSSILSVAFLWSITSIARSTGPQERHKTSKTSLEVFGAFSVSQRTFLS